MGVGGAGTNLLTHAIAGGVSPRNCVAVGRALNRLSESPAKNKVLFAENILDGSHSTERSHDIQLLAHRVSPFTRESDFTILLAGLGGITGTSAAPTIAQLNRSRVRRVMSVVSLPFIHERERRFIALRGLKRMVESCDCTVVVDNAAQLATTSKSERRADVTTGLAVKALSEAITTDDVVTSNRILRILSLGQIAIVGEARINSVAGIQIAVNEALGSRSANLPLSRARGAVVVFNGQAETSSGDAFRAYEAVTSLVGHDLDFVHITAETDSAPSLLIFLTGYSYESALRSFADLLEELYDLEFGSESAKATIAIPMRMYQMETL